MIAECTQTAVQTNSFVGGKIEIICIKYIYNKIEIFPRIKKKNQIIFF